MMQMSVKALPMEQAADEMYLIRKKVDICGSELTQIRHDLAALSSLDEQLEQLRRCEEQLEQQARYCTLFGNMIRQICRQYFHTESKIIEHSELVERKAWRESLSGRDLRGLSLLFHKVIFMRGGDQN